MSTHPPTGLLPHRVSSLLAGFLLLYAAVSCLRLIDADEGYLLYAAQRVARGATLYEDGLYTQPPAMAWLYSLVFRAHGGWYGSRLLSALLAWSTLPALVSILRRQAVPERVIAVAVVAQACTGLSLFWLPIAKTYALCAAALTWAHALSFDDRKERPLRRAFLVGALVALASATRLYAALAAPLLLFHLLRAERAKVRSTLAFALGGAVVALPCALAVAAAGERGLFSVVGYHLNRWPAPLSERLNQKLWVVQMLVGLDGPDWFLGFQLAMIAALLTRVRVMSPSAQLAALLGLVSLLPNPTFPQYFSIVVPFLIATIATHRREVPRSFSFAALAFVCLLLPEAWRYFRAGEGVSGVEGRLDAWTIRSVSAVGSRACAEARGAPILTTWPGYLVGTPCAAARGTGNHFAREAGDRITDPARRARLGVWSHDDLFAWIRRRGAPYVLVGHWHRGGQWEVPLTIARYRAVFTEGGAWLWRAP